MTRISAVEADLIFDLRGKIAAAVSGASHLDEAAQAFTRCLYDTFHETLVLARVYVVVPQRHLPPSVESWARRFASWKGHATDFGPDTPILTQVGTTGSKPEWNKRLTSSGHQAIPLLSSRFVSEVPMVAALLRDLGVGLQWLDDRNLSHVHAALRNQTATFYVGDPETTKDDMGRLVIPAQDFVREQGVKTVFGLGASYAGGGLLVLICFCNEHVQKRSVEALSVLLSTLKAATAKLVPSGAIVGGS